MVGPKKRSGESAMQALAQLVDGPVPLVHQLGGEGAREQGAEQVGRVLLCSQISGVAPSLQHRWNSDRLARTAMDLAVSGRLRLVELISHTMPIGQAPEAFQLLDEHPEQVMQVVLSFAHDGQQVAA